MNHPPAELRRTIGTRLPITKHEPWRDQANCIGTNPELFFSSIGVSWATKLDIVAEHCDPCPVAKECFEHGLQQDDGIYGLGLVRQTGRTIDVTRLQHGTLGGYKRHHYRNETPCEPCRKAKVADSRQRRAS